MRVEPFFRVYKFSLQFFDKDDQKILIVTTDTLSKFSLTKFLMENFDSDNGPYSCIIGVRGYGV